MKLTTHTIIFHGRIATSLIYIYFVFFFTKSLLNFEEKEIKKNVLSFDAPLHFVAIMW